MKDLIQELRTSIFRSPLTDKAAAALEHLTAGDVALPEPVAQLHPNHLAADQDRPMWCREVLLYSPDNEGDKLNGVNTRVRIHTNAQLIDYGNRKDAAGYLRGVAEERERCALVCEARITPGTGSVNILLGAAEAIRKGTP